MSNYTNRIIYPRVENPFHRSLSDKLLRFKFDNAARRFFAFFLDSLLIGLSEVDLSAITEGLYGQKVPINDCNPDL